jgi:DNA-binding transcriptional LysR family regulator
MFEQLKRMATLVTVVEQGSFGAAARALGTTTSAVSQQVRALEHSLGMALLARTTRQLRLTTAGEAFHRECVAMVDAARRAEQTLQTLKDAPSGELRMTAPAGFVAHLCKALAPVLLRHPALRLHVLAEDAMSDLVGQRIDVALRFGRLPDSNWVATRLGRMDMVLCASPAYLARCGRPERPDEAGPFELIALDLETGASARGVSLQKLGQGPQHALSWPVRVSGNNQPWVQHMCEAGLGIALLTEWDAHDALASGRLQRVMPQWTAPGLDMYAVVQPRSARTPKVRVAIEALAKLVTQSQHVVTAPS